MRHYVCPQIPLNDILLQLRPKHLKIRYKIQKFKTRNVHEAGGVCVCVGGAGSGIILDWLSKEATCQDIEPVSETDT